MAKIAVLRNVGGLIFDATFREAHTSEIEVTENPIENGSDIADNMTVKGDKLTIHAGVSNSPLHSSVDDQFAGKSRTQAAFSLLRALQRSGEPFSIQTGLILYENMMCMVVRAEQDKDTSQVLEFDADFKGVLIVGTQSVTYPARAPGKTSHQASQTVKKGEQQGSQVTAPAKTSSLTKKGYDIWKKFSSTITNP